MLESDEFPGAGQLGSAEGIRVRDLQAESGQTLTGEFLLKTIGLSRMSRVLFEGSKPPVRRRVAHGSNSDAPLATAVCINASKPRARTRRRPG
jgi:hypothetical protein